MCMFRTRYAKDVKAPSHGIEFVQPSQAIQSEKEGTTIDYYLRKYASTGVLGDPESAMNMQFGDFTDAPDFETAQNRVVQASRYFDNLPAKLRERFGNDVREMMAFLSKEENHAEAVKLGLLEAVASPSDPAVVPPVDPVVPSVEPTVPTGTPAETDNHPSPESEV
mgnify:CR=1 FL=1